MIDEEELGHRFGYHLPPDDAREIRHGNVRHKLLEAAVEVDANVPDGREKSLAITALEEAMHWANAGISRELT